MSPARSAHGAARRSASKKRALPVAFVKRAEKLAAGKRARLEREAREAIALIKRRKSEIAEAFYDIADALVRLQEPMMLAGSP